MKRLLLLGAFPLLQSCDDPGEGRTARAGYAYCDPIVRELRAYRSAHGHYPASLPLLWPETHHPPPPDNIDVSYSTDSQRQAFTLRFTYSGPGVNECSYTPAGGQWSCDGYY